MRAFLIPAIFGLCTAVFHATPQDRLLVDAYAAAAKAMGYGRKQIADWLGLLESQLDRQLRGDDGQHFSMYRAARGPAIVMREWLKRVCAAYGLYVIDREELAQLIDAMRAQVGTQRRQQRMVLPAEQERRRA